MLKQLLADWNTAIQSRKVVNGTTSPDGIVLTQSTKFKFRNTEFEMFTKLMPGDENAPERKRRYRNEIFVPKTNKFVPTGTFKSHSAMMAAILCAITEGNDHEDRIAKRNQKRKETVFAELRKERKTRLSSSGYTPEEVDVILNWIDGHVYDDHVSWCETAVDIMCKYNQYITGRGLIELGIDLKDEARRHIDRMYATIVNLMRDNVRDKYGYPTYTKRTLSYQFLFPKENLSYGIYTVRSAYAKIFNDCDFCSKFHYVTELIAALYEHMTGTSLQDKSNEIKMRQERMYEKRVKKAIDGHKHNNSERVTLAQAVPIVGTSIGDMFGDVLDVVETAHEAPSKPVKHHKKKSEKVVPTVTNRQVTSLQDSLKHEDIDEKEEQLPPVPESIELDEKEEPVESPVEDKLTVEESSESVGAFNNVFAEALEAAGVDELVQEKKPKKRTTRKKKEVVTE